MTNLDIMVCPECHKRLSQNNNKIKCDFCIKEWDIVDGVPRFANNEFYWGEISKEEASMLINVSKELSWRHGIEKVLKEKYPNIYEYIINELRDEFRYILPLTNDSVVLDIGAGWGNISVGLSNYAGAVYALELISERVEFIKIRSAQEKIKNLSVMMANMMKLPFADNSFDCIVVNGVLEWVGLYDKYTDPYTLQCQFLKEMHRVLKPNGCIYIGIENRLGYGMFFGALDHTGLRYTSLMPRWLADLYCRFVSVYGYRTDKRLEGYSTYTYSKWGYRGLLEYNSFSNIKFFMPLPSYNMPLEFVDLDNKITANYYIKHFVSGDTLKKKIKKKLLLAATWLGMASLFSDDFTIIARKADKDDLVF